MVPELGGSERERKLLIFLHPSSFVLNSTLLSTKKRTFTCPLKKKPAKNCLVKRIAQASLVDGVTYHFFAKRSHVKITYIYNHGGLLSLNRTIFAEGIALDTNWLNQSLWNLVQSNLYITATLRNRAIKALSSNINTLNKI